MTINGLIKSTKDKALVAKILNDRHRSEKALPKYDLAVKPYEK